MLIEGSTSSAHAQRRGFRRLRAKSTTGSNAWGHTSPGDFGGRHTETEATEFPANAEAAVAQCRIRPVRGRMIFRGTLIWHGLVGAYGMLVPDLGQARTQIHRALRIRQDFLVTSSSGRSNPRTGGATRYTSCRGQEHRRTFFRPTASSCIINQNQRQRRRPFRQMARYFPSDSKSTATDMIFSPYGELRENVRPFSFCPSKRKMDKKEKDAEIKSRK